MSPNRAFSRLAVRHKINVTGTVPQVWEKWRLVAPLFGYPQFWRAPRILAICGPVLPSSRARPMNSKRAVMIRPPFGSQGLPPSRPEIGPSAGVPKAGGNPRHCPLMHRQSLRHGSTRPRCGSASPAATAQGSGTASSPAGPWRRGGSARSPVQQQTGRAGPGAGSHPGARRACAGPDASRREPGRRPV